MSHNKVALPIRIESEANRRDHWAARHRRFKGQQRTTLLLLSQAPKPPLPCTATLTRIGRRLLDGDNLAGGFKAVRDAIAHWLGIDDADPRVTWTYAQRAGKTYGIEVEFS